jgi:hypothetical protein
MKLPLTMVTAVFGATLILEGCGGGGGPGGRGFRGMGPPGMGSPGPSREGQLQRFDANADGTITRDEFDKVLAVDFQAADTSHDGKLSTAETAEVNHRLLAVREISPILDWNADGSISLAEFGSQWLTMFKRADANEDGVITAEELSRPAFDGPGPRGKPPGGPGGRGGPPGGGPPGGGRPGG